MLCLIVIHPRQNDYLRARLITKEKSKSSAEKLISEPVLRVCAKSISLPELFVRRIPWDSVKRAVENRGK
jgi:hypothetical protein